VDFWYRGSVVVFCYGAEGVLLAVGYGFKWISVAGTAPQLDFHEDERLGSLVQNTITSEVRFHAKLAEYDVERLEVARA
jgi:hypothetical protein